MRIRTFIVLCLSLSILSGCGGGGGSGAPADTPASEVAAVTLTASKSLVLADGTDAVTIGADVRKADGTAVADGTSVAFSVPENSGILSAASASTTNGFATVTLTLAPISGQNNRTLTVRGTSGSITGVKDVKFINQPASADVLIAFDQAVTNLAALNFKLNSSAGASFNNSTQPVLAINGAIGSLVVGNFDGAVSSTNIGLVNGGAGGCNTGTAPIIKATFAVAPGTGLPLFTVDLTPATFTATDPLNGAVTPQVTAANTVVTVVFDTEL